MPNLSAGQCRAGRALLDMSQAELAEAAGCGVSSVADLEGRRRVVSVAIISALRKALEARGVVLIEADEHGGEGVRLVPARRGKRRRG